MSKVTRDHKVVKCGGGFRASCKYKRSRVDELLQACCPKKGTPVNATKEITDRELLKIVLEYLPTEGAMWHESMERTGAVDAKEVRKRLTILMEKYGDLTDDVVTATSIKHVPWR